MTNEPLTASELGKRIGDRIAELILANNPSIAGFADPRDDVSDEQLSRWRTGDAKTIDLMTVIAWADALGVSRLQILADAGLDGEPVSARSRAETTLRECGVDEDVITLALGRLDNQAATRIRVPRQPRRR